jgi:hypothetical protein
MWARCTNRRHKNWPDYGGRGIAVCAAWRSFAAFCADMGPRPPGATIERENNDRGYEPGNCRWATRREQSRNRRDIVRITAWGETKTRSAWLEDARCVVGLGTLRHRLAHGWSPEGALSTKVQ